MSFGRLYRASPLGCIGVFLMGGVFSALFGMSSVWGASTGMTVRDISVFVAAIYIGGLMLQFPIGWLSDRMDRRKLILGLSVFGSVVIAATIALQPNIWWLMIVGALIGGVANPVYALLLAYTNDYLDQSDMAAASAGLLFINGLGSMTGPLITGWLMGLIGPDGFWVYMGILLAALAIYAGWRMTRRASISVEDQGSYAVITPSATTLAVSEALDEAQSDSVASDPADEDLDADPHDDIPQAVENPDGRSAG